MPIPEWTSLAIIAVVVAAILFGLWRTWPVIKPFFADSETLLWARLQMLVGIIWSVLLATDISPILQAAGWGKWAAAVVVVQGLITEIARKSRTVGGVTGQDLTSKVGENKSP